MSRGREKKKPRKKGGASVGCPKREREWSEDKNGRRRKTEGKRERSVNSNQRSRALRIECECTSVCVHACLQAHPRS